MGLSTLYRKFVKKSLIRIFNETYTNLTQTVVKASYNALKKEQFCCICIDMHYYCLHGSSQFTRDFAVYAR